MKWQRFTRSPMDPVQQGLPRRDHLRGFRLSGKVDPYQRIRHRVGENISRVLD